MAIRRVTNDDVRLVFLEQIDPEQGAVYLRRPGVPLCPLANIGEGKWGFVCVGGTDDPLYVKPTFRAAVTEALKAGQIIFHASRFTPE